MENALKLLPIGGIGGVTKNMYLYEYNNQILIVDCGVGFPTTGMLGVDVLIPDISYLKGKENQIVGMLLTHAHDDHIAALPYIMPQLPDIPVYASSLTAGFAADRLKDFNVRVNFQTFPDDTNLKLGPFTIESVKVTHSVPDTRHYLIQTPMGNIYHGSDFKFDLTPVDGVISDYNKIARFGDRGVLCLLSDCLRSEKTGHSLSESILTESFQREFRGIKGKLLVTAMSSSIHRIQQVVDVATSYGRQVAFIGRSVEQNIKTATRLGFFKISQKAIVNKRRINKLPPNKICVIIAGSQGQPESSLTRAALGQHKLVSINSDDKVVFSSEPIPGNEDNVYNAIDNISKLGAEVSYSDVDDNLHVSGHASALEQKLLMELTKPKFLVPIGGTYRHMVQYRILARSMGHNDKQVFLLQDGQTLLIDHTGIKLGEKIKLTHVMVDGTGVGDVGQVVLSDRQTMSKSGIVVIVLPIDQNSGQLKGRPEIISRGFVFMKQSSELITQLETATMETIDKHHDKLGDWKSLRKFIASDLEDLIYHHTQRSPLVLPVIMHV
ncbi:ribonuclease J [Pseudomonadota bacterium]